MSKFKKGQKVYDKVEKKWGIITGVPGDKNYDDSGYCAYNKGCTLIYENEKYDTWTYMSELEEFLEPKYKVGDIIRAFPLVNQETAEIVKCIFNKVRKTYHYVAYCTDETAYPVMQDESNIVLVNTNCPKCGTKI